MDKTYKTELHKIYLVEHLPEPMKLADRHLQIFDNYIQGTRMRIRSVRVPETNEWTWTLQQRFPVSDDLVEWKVSDIVLNEEEHNRFERFEGREIRKNRYFHEHDGKMLEIDVHLGPLWGLNILHVEFESLEEARAFEPPPCAVLDVTAERFFMGENLVVKTFTDVQGAVARIVGTTHSYDTHIQEVAKANE